MNRLHLVCLIVISLLLSSVVGAEEWKPIPRRLPPAGTALSADQRQQLQESWKKLDARIRETRPDVSDELLPDVEVYSKTVRFALDFEEFYRPQDFANANKLLAAANQRLDELTHSQHSWTKQHGLVVRGYRSDVDGSAQPYGLEIPESIDLSKPAPLYVWLHGRGDNATDFHFIVERQSRKGQIQPADAIVVHPFGRQCLGFKSGGETDVLDAIESVEHRYKIDPDRVILMGFSMGGAGAWHLGGHYADHFAAVHAGAGFVDVARYQKLKPDKYPAWYEQKLWGMYDAPDYVRNLFNVPMLAYGGEIDPQRASSQIMAEAFKAEGHELQALVGPGMGHKYDPGSLAEIMRRMKAAEEKGRDWYARQITLQTRTVCYNRMKWATITALEREWEDTRLDANLVDDHHIDVKTKNVAGFKLSNAWRNPPGGSVQVVIDGNAIDVASSSFGEGASFAKAPDGKFIAGGFPPHPGMLAKLRGLQGPIDDAFMSPFLVVVPSGKCASPQVQRWMKFELAHQIDRWRAVFRGDLRMKHDTEVTPEDIKRYHLVLWGDPGSNQIMGKIAQKLPIHWNTDGIDANGQKFDAATHVPVMIYPNPLNASKYVVLNSGPTFREDDDRTNSLQNPKLPDWAILDITSQPTAHAAGKVMAAGFFDVHWRFDGDV